jgi:hypothetical protein
MSVCKQTYYNNGSYLRARSNEKAICDLVKEIENGSIIPSIVSKGGIFQDSIVINGDLRVNGEITYQNISFDTFQTDSINTNSITMCDNYTISCGDNGININTTINVDTINVTNIYCCNLNDVSYISVDTLSVNNPMDTLTVNVFDCSYNTVEMLTADTANIEDLIVTNSVDNLGITILDSSNAIITDLSSTNIDVSNDITLNGYSFSNLTNIYSGVIDVSNSGNTSGPFTITFPTPYTSTPIVLLTSHGTARQYFVNTISVNSATISQGNGTGYATSIYWMSMMPS